MKFAIVYNAVLSEVLSTAIYRGFVDKDYWNERVGSELHIGLRRVELSG